MQRRWKIFIEFKRHVEKSEDLLEDQREMLKVLHNNNRIAFSRSQDSFATYAYSGLGGNLSFALAILNYDNAGCDELRSCQEGSFLYIQGKLWKAVPQWSWERKKNLALEEALGYRRGRKTEKGLFVNSPEFIRKKFWRTKRRTKLVLSSIFSRSSLLFYPCVSFHG